MLATVATINDPPTVPDTALIPAEPDLVQFGHQFELAWRLGRRPRIENFLVGITGPVQVELLKHLVTIELDLRSGRGDRPRAALYRARFPGQAAAIDAAFLRAVVLRRRPARRPPGFGPEPIHSGLDPRP